MSPGTAPTMKWYDEVGHERKLYQSGANRLKLIAEKAPVGRLQTPTRWKTEDVRNFQDQGIWDVNWVEPGDTEREHGWIITGLTAKGRNLLREWDRRVVQGAGTRGPKRTSRGDIA